MDDNKNDIQGEKLEPVNVATTQDKIVPKFCNTINVDLLKSKNVVLTMAYSEGKDNIALIDRVVIDFEHAKSLSNALKQLLEDVNNDSTLFS
jgi:hypothetical protein